MAEGMQTKRGDGRNDISVPFLGSVQESMVRGNATDGGKKDVISVLVKTGRCSNKAFVT